ncbi:hypothetical protein UFOVP407_18 [uncultured Caudovirales phage]|uniref:Uncharacterized protein n=1 Tax=uncultured Caudovirales phage TaxID=2100421 RepID=A0A6J5M3W5_9CAUD|nr:hypothetical protein UFOVP407_18 [uncultured Caudovirales phage]
MAEVTVTQEAREAAAEYLREYGPYGLRHPAWIASLLDGERDDLDLLQAFARLEQSAFAAGKRAGLMEAAEIARAETDIVDSHDPFDAGWGRGAVKIATAIEERANAD